MRDPDISRLGLNLKILVQEVSVGLVDSVVKAVALAADLPIYLEIYSVLSAVVEEERNNKIGRVAI